MGAMKIADSKIVRICEQCGEVFIENGLSDADCKASCIPIPEEWSYMGATAKLRLRDNKPKLCKSCMAINTSTDNPCQALLNRMYASQTCAGHMMEDQCKAIIDVLGMKNFEEFRKQFAIETYSINCEDECSRIVRRSDGKQMGVRIISHRSKFFLDQNLDNWKLDYAMHESLDAMIADAEAQAKVGEI